MVRKNFSDLALCEDENTNKEVIYSLSFAMTCFFNLLHQAILSDYNQRMRSHYLSNSGGFHGDAIG